MGLRTKVPCLMSEVHAEYQKKPYKPPKPVVKEAQVEYN